MKLAIDASTMREGGGLKYLKKLIENFDRDYSDIKSLFIFVDYFIYDSIKSLSRDGIMIYRLPKKSFFGINILIWKIFCQKKIILQNNCDFLYCLSGYNLSNYSNFISIIHNQLPFERKEVFRYSFFKIIKFEILRFFLSLHLKQAKGVIFLSSYSRDRINDLLPNISNEQIIIPHGLDKENNKLKLRRLKKTSFNHIDPFKIVYLSNFEPYKHQEKVAKAVSNLRDKGFPIEISFIGEVVRSGIKIKNKINKFDESEKFLKMLGWLPTKDIEKIMIDSDLFIFASSCESFGQIVLEGMRWGMPMTCSRGNAMEEILEDCDVNFFDPLKIIDIENNIKQLFFNESLRQNISDKVFIKSQNFSWEKTFKDTLSFVSFVHSSK